jgi:hypothetical protein
MTDDESDESEHICYGTMRLVTPLPIEQQVADWAKSTDSERPTKALD